MNRARFLKRLNTLFAVFITIFNVVATVNVGIQYAQHGWEWVEVSVQTNGEEYEIIHETQTIVPMILMLIFLYVLLALLLVNAQFLRSLEPDAEESTAEDKST